MSNPSVAEYYDRNTRRFLRLGQHQKTRNIHQPLWAPGIAAVDDAVNWSNDLILRELRNLGASTAGRTVLDLGCGVGSTAFYLARNYQGEAQYIGLSISQLQVDLANAFRAQEAGGTFCEFLCGDFLELPALPAIDLAYAIEAFIHARDSAKFFASVGDALAPGGRLVVIDDFLTDKGASAGLSAEHNTWLKDFRSGWLAESLVTEQEAEGQARSASLQLVESESLTSYMKLGRPRDKLIGIMRRLFAPMMRRSTYWRALNGGYAKQQCLKNGLVDYRRLVFEVVPPDEENP